MYVLTQLPKNDKVYIQIWYYGRPNIFGTLEGQISQVQYVNSCWKIQQYEYQLQTRMMSVNLVAFINLRILTHMNMW